VDLAPRSGSLPGDPGAWRQGEPLWKRAPTRVDGAPCTDFMLVAPGLNKRPAHEIEALALVVRGVLETYPDWVVFADLNLKLNVLWVSLKYRRGIMAEVVAVLRARAPIFKLVGHSPQQGI
jgi:hypothetical protein